MYADWQTFFTILWQELKWKCFILSASFVRHIFSFTRIPWNFQNNLQDSNEYNGSSICAKVWEPLRAEWVFYINTYLRVGQQQQQQKTASSWAQFQLWTPLSFTHIPATARCIMLLQKQNILCRTEQVVLCCRVNYWPSSL